MFDSDPLCFDLYNELDERVIGEIENTAVVCNKPQVSFLRKHMHMCAFLRVRKMICQHCNDRSQEKAGQLPCICCY